MYDVRWNDCMLAQTVYGIPGESLACLRIRAVPFFPWISPRRCHVSTIAVICLESACRPRSNSRRRWPIDLGRWAMAMRWAVGSCSCRCCRRAVLVLLEIGDGRSDGVQWEMVGRFPFGGLVWGAAPCLFGRARDCADRGLRDDKRAPGRSWAMGEETK